MSEVNRSEFQVLLCRAYHHGEGNGIYVISGVRQLDITDVLYEKSAYDTLSTENKALREALEETKDILSKCFTAFENQPRPNMQMCETVNQLYMKLEALGKVKS